MGLVCLMTPQEATEVSPSTQKLPVTCTYPVGPLLAVVLITNESAQQWAHLEDTRGHVAELGTPHFSPHPLSLCSFTTHFYRRF